MRVTGSSRGSGWAGGTRDRFDPALDGWAAAVLPPPADVGWLATTWFASTAAWLVGGIAFVAVLVGLLTYWSRSFAQIQAAVRPMFPTPPEARDAPI